ncbi:MAG: hypothetical protein ABW061_22210 [Polyangiaceae bacterium]
MPRICPPFGSTPFGRPFHVLSATSVALLLAVAACGNTETSPLGTGGAAGSAGAAIGSAGAHATAGAGNSPASSEAGAGGSDQDPPVAAAGAAGSEDASEAGAAGVGGSESAACAAGGALFVVGNYANAAGDQLLLRSTATAATLALVPHGEASPTALPQLFLVERTCAPRNALIVRDESAYYRLDFSQVGGHFAFCASASVATLDAAVLLTPADVSRATSTGCSGKPFSSFDAEAL